MHSIDRRHWLKMIGLLGAGGAASRLGASPTPTPASAAPTSAPTSAALTSAAPASSAPGSAGVRLSLNENPFGPAASAVEAIQRESGNLCRYTDRGFRELIEGIATKEGVSQDQIILGEILEPLGTHLSLQGGPGGEFIYSDPGYTALIDSAAAVVGVGVPVPLDKEMLNDLPGIAARVNPHTRAIFLVNPHNPTGTVADADGLKAFARRASATALVIVDEAYLEFSDDFPRRTLADLVREGSNVIVFRTFAKVYGLAGLDIGYGLVPKEVAKTLEGQGLNNPHLFNRLAVAAAAASIKDRNYVENVVRKVAAERALWFELLKSLNVNTSASVGNFVFLESGMPHADFAGALLRHGVDIGRAFPPFDRWARISIGLPHENAIARAAVRKLLTAR